MMESIKKLRESLEDCTSEAGIEPNRFDTYWITARACDMLIDEIEAEIAERYMELPVDADGVPIHVGDEMQSRWSDNIEKVIAIGDNSFFKGENALCYGRCVDADESWHHYHAPTVDDVLREFANKVLNSGHQWGLDAQETIAETADKLREVLRDE